MGNIYPTEILAQVKAAPASPGCYLYSDQYENIIYVGKAKHLKKRVASYFTAAAEQDERLEELLPKIAAIEYRTTACELDALILEYQLIKRYKPWFNSVMKADKQRPFLRIGSETPYPTLSAAAERAEDDAEYYDIFTDTDEIKAFLAVFGGVWGTAQCGKVRLGTTASPCLYHSLGQCLAPCAGKADETQYGEAVSEIRALLKNQRVPKIMTLERAMDVAARRLEFEKAAQYRKQLELLERLQLKARRMYHYPDGANVLVLIRPYREQALVMFAVRDGAVVARFDLEPNPSLEDMAQIAETWNGLDAPLEGGEVLAKCLTEISAQKTFIKLPDKITGGRLHREIEAYKKASQKRK